MKTLTQSILTLGTILSVGLAAPVAGRAQTRFDGAWHAAFVLNGQHCTLDLVMGSGQSYSEVAQCGSLMTRQAGTYVFEDELLVRTVLDYEPRDRYVVDSAGSSYPDGWGRYQPPTGHRERNATPPGGSYRVTFNSPGTMVWQDVNFGGSVTYWRVR